VHRRRRPGPRRGSLLLLLARRRIRPLVVPRALRLVTVQRHQARVLAAEDQSLGGTVPPLAVRMPQPHLELRHRRRRQHLAHSPGPFHPQADVLGLSCGGLRRCGWEPMLHHGRVVEVRPPWRHRRDRCRCRGHPAADEAPDPTPLHPAMRTSDSALTSMSWCRPSRPAAAEPRRTRKPPVTRTSRLLQAHASIGTPAPTLPAPKRCRV
jgi:hypothetical protein